MIFGLVPISILTYVVYTLLLTHITVISVTIFLHRSHAHRALDIHPALSHFFRFWLWLTTSIVTKEWVSVHRKHHTECEGPNDPHSPQILGLRKVLFEGAELYRDEALKKETLERYGKGCPDDWVENHVYSHLKWRHVGIFLMFAINVVLFGIPGVAIWAIQMMWIPFFAAGVVNGVGHFWGYRNFESPDASKNFSPVGIIMGGEELHNNHHTFATSAKLSVHWWEFDIGWCYIRVFQWLRLVSVNRSIPKLYEDKSKIQLDTESLKAILNHRFQIMDHYWRKVIRPVLRAEKRGLNKPSRRVMKLYGRLLAKDEALISSKEKKHLHFMLSHGIALKTVYQFQLKLQEFWQQHQDGQAELLESLRNWCKQAEATGIAVLQEFAHRLGCYRLGMSNN